MPNKNSRTKRTAAPKARTNTQIVSAMRQTSGSMAVATNPARERKTIRTRMFIVPVWNSKTSGTVLSQSQSPSPLGAQYQSNHITITPNDLGGNAVEFLQNSDRYRITKAELFVLSTVDAKTNTTKSTAPIAHYAYCDRDTSISQTGGVTPWTDVVSRDNVSKTILRANAPIMRIAHWNPSPIYNPTGGNSPTNAIPSPNTWMDSLILNQEFSGVRTFSTCPVESATNDQYRYDLHYEVRVTIQTQAAL